jgi:type IV fimbrial biogenesis protein FimT
MRQLNTQRGLTLIELMVGFAIATLLAVAAAPFFGDYGINSRLREGGNTLYAETLFAQSEAIKRNRPVRVSTSASTITVEDMTVLASPVTLRTRTLSEGVSVATGSVMFGTSGWPSNLTAASINLSHSSATCSADYRCPGLRVEAGGAISS